MANLSVCPSVRHTPTRHPNKCTYHQTLSAVSQGGMTLVFRALPSLQNSKRNSLSVGVNTRGWENIAIFDRNRRLSQKRYEIGPWLLWIIGIHPWVLSHHANFGHSRSNHTSVTMEIRQKCDPSRHAFQGHSRSLELTRIDPCQFQ